MGSGFPERKYDIHHQWPTPHAKQALQSWSKLNSYIKSGTVHIDGKSLDVAAVVAIARSVPKLCVLKKAETNELF